MWVGESVGAAVGDAVGVDEGIAVGAVVGAGVGAAVGVAVGASVAMQAVLLCGSVRKPSRHWHVWPPRGLQSLQSEPYSHTL